MWCFTEIYAGNGECGVYVGGAGTGVTGPLRSERVVRGFVRGQVGVYGAGGWRMPSPACYRLRIIWRVRFSFGTLICLPDPLS